MTGATSTRPDPEATGDEPTGAPANSASANQLAQTLSELARTLEAEDDTESMLGDLVAAAVAQIPGVDEGSISVVLGRRDVSSQSPSSDLPRRVDALQTTTGEGPCLDAVYDEKVVSVPDMASETRWPRFAPLAAEAGASSMLSFQLWVEGDNLGALNLYGREAHAFTEESEHVGLLFVSHAAVAMAGAQKHDQLVAGLATRDLIGQAKGILMERYKIDAQKAFSLLVRASQHRNLKLRDLAAELTDTGRIAGVTPASPSPPRPGR
ncbi:GAF domain-containing protein [Friedmanniella luteola]|uniref:GAF domain-containing protein n=1 Tax=Friedmanniella luteola TaxID=546871 RepID=A0A1H1STJ2_9ACTN|nr:GAF and ANTAR domain-containing protein [Friedmanniella luteola]SDS51046.1 GAF domain-containing protein [Friedmanniella luteola]